MSRYTKPVVRETQEQLTRRIRASLDMMADATGKARVPETQTEQHYDGLAVKRAERAERPARVASDVPAVSEKEIQAAIFDWLKVEPRVGLCVRVNSGRMPWQKAPGQPIRWISFYRMFLRLIGKVRDEGHSDIYCVLKPSGRYVALEVKVPGKKTTEEQQDFLDAVIAAGGIGACVHSLDEAMAALESA